MSTLSSSWLVSYAENSLKTCAPKLQKVDEFLFSNDKPPQKWLNCYWKPIFEEDSHNLTWDNSFETKEGQSVISHQQQSRDLPYCNPDTCWYKSSQVSCFRLPIENTGTYLRGLFRCFLPRFAVTREEFCVVWRICGWLNRLLYHRIF